MADKLTVFVFSGAIVMVCALAGRVKADEAFVCGPDQVVYVKSDEIALRKLTDACVAAHFGLRVPDSIAAAPSPAPMPANVTGTATIVHDIKLAMPPRAIAPVARAAPVTTPARFAASPSAATDYRRVRILNATSESSAWFFHTR